MTATLQLPEYTSGTPLARPSEVAARCDCALLCLTCGMEGAPGEFIDGRRYSILADDTYDCCCCGMTTVVEVRAANTKITGRSEQGKELNMNDKQNESTASAANSGTSGCAGSEFCYEEIKTN